MDYTTLLEENKGEQVCSSSQIQSLYQVCQQLKDGRKARGRQYDLAGVLLLLVLAKLAGMNSLLAASEWGKDQEKIIRANVNLSWKRMPCANTYSYVLARLDSQQINAHLAAWFVRQMSHQRAGDPGDRRVHLARDSQSAQKHWGASIRRRTSPTPPSAYL